MQKFNHNLLVVLMGYAGSGKSTVGKLLAQELAVRYVDLDTWIQEQEQQAISEIFKNKGEIYFRKLESRALAELLSNTDPQVISLGGGTPCYGTNAQLISESAYTSFYLQANVPTLVSRLSDATQHRPLLANVPDLASYVGQHLFEREKFYRTANFTIQTANKTVTEVVGEILNTLS